VTVFSLSHTPAENFYVINEMPLHSQTKSYRYFSVYCL